MVTTMSKEDLLYVRIWRRLGRGPFDIRFNNLTDAHRFRRYLWLAVQKVDKGRDDWKADIVHDWSGHRIEASLEEYGNVRRAFKAYESLQELEKDLGKMRDEDKEFEND